MPNKNRKKLGNQKFDQKTELCIQKEPSPKPQKSEDENLKACAIRVMKDYWRAPEEVQDEMLEVAWFRRVLISDGFLAGKSEIETMNWINEITGREKGPIGIEEIEFFYGKMNAKQMDYKTPLVLLKRQGKNAVHFTKFLTDINSDLLRNKKTVIEEMEVANIQHHGQSYIQVATGRDLRKITYNHGVVDHTKSSLADFLTFLEFCYEHRVTVKLLKLTMFNVKRCPNFLEMLLSYEIVAKVAIEAVEMKNDETKVVDSLAVAKYVKCKKLTIEWSCFEYGRADKFVEAMRNCHPNLQKCTIKTEKSIPHYFNYWNRFDDFDVVAGKNYVHFEKSNG